MYQLAKDGHKPNSHEVDDRPPVGTPIPGSRFVVGYCEGCDEQMRITTDRIGLPTSCNECRHRRTPTARALPAADFVASAARSESQRITALPPENSLILERLRDLVGASAYITALSAARKLAVQSDVSFEQAVEMLIQRLEAQQE